MTTASSETCGTVRLTLNDEGQTIWAGTANPGHDRELLDALRLLTPGRADMLNGKSVV